MNWIEMMKLNLRSGQGKVLDALVTGIFKELQGLGAPVLTGQFPQTKQMDVDALAQDVLYHNIRLRLCSPVEQIHSLFILYGN